jgi:hypothetical protein
LKQPLLVVDDAFGRADLGDLFQPVVAVDDAPVQIVQVDVAKRPPSSCTIGRSSGEMTGTRPGSSTRAATSTR